MTTEIRTLKLELPKVIINSVDSETAIVIPELTRVQLKEQLANLFENNSLAILFQKLPLRLNKKTYGAVFLFWEKIHKELQKRNHKFIIFYSNPSDDVNTINEIETDPYIALRKFANVDLQSYKVGGFSKGIFGTSKGFTINENYAKDYLSLKLDNFNDVFNVIEKSANSVREFAPSFDLYSIEIKVDNKAEKLRELKKQLEAEEIELSLLESLRKRLDSNFMYDLSKKHEGYIFELNEKLNLCIMTPFIVLKDLILEQQINAGNYFVEFNILKGEIEKLIKLSGVDMPSPHPHIQKSKRNSNKFDNKNVATDSGRFCGGNTINAIRRAKDIRKGIYRGDDSSYRINGKTYLKELCQQGFYQKAVSFLIDWLNEFNNNGAWYHPSNNDDYVTLTCSVCGATGHNHTQCPARTVKCSICGQEVLFELIDIHVDEYHSEEISTDLEEPQQPVFTEIFNPQEEYAEDSLEEEAISLDEPDELIDDELPDELIDDESADIIATVDNSIANEYNRTS